MMPQNIERVLKFAFCLKKSLNFWGFNDFFFETRAIMENFIFYVSLSLNKLAGKQGIELNNEISYVFIYVRTGTVHR